jgi:hypothetical protein
VLNPAYLAVFIEYFPPTLIVVTIMLNRTLLLRVLLGILRYLFTPVQNFFIRSNTTLTSLIDEINSQEFVYFTKGDDVATLNKVMQYIQNNEHTRKLRVVTAVPKGEKPTDQMLSDIDVLDREYPNIKIDFIVLEDKFGPQLINRLSKEWKIPVNFMFIGSPGDRFPYKVEQLGGVRLII